MRLLTWRLLPIASHYSGALVFGLIQKKMSLLELMLVKFAQSFSTFNLATL